MRAASARNRPMVDALKHRTRTRGTWRPRGVGEVAIVPPIGAPPKISLKKTIVYFIVCSVAPGAVVAPGSMTTIAAISCEDSSYGISKMRFGEAVSTCFNKYPTFSGRAPHAEYWYWSE
jgi:hypothetical protein